MKELLAILEVRLKERRIYKAPFDYAGYVKTHWDRLNFQCPGRVVGQPPHQEPGGMVYSDFWVLGDGGHSELASSYCLTLPSDFLHFTSRFAHYALVLRNCIHIGDAKEVSEITEGLRAGEDINPDSPYFLYRFAEIPREASNFMFRWNADGSFRDIAFARYSDSSEHDILGPDSEIYSCDADFTSWFIRMVTSDGAPLHTEHSDEMDFFVERVTPMPPK